MKTCTICKSTKPLDEYCRRTSAKDGRNGSCLECERERKRKVVRTREQQDEINRRARERYKELDPESLDARLARGREWHHDNAERIRANKRFLSYKMTLEEYEKRLADQEGGCAACGGLNPNGRHLDVDHDHSCCPTPPTCGKCNRGLLCNDCNRAEGLLKSDPERVEALLDYVRKNATVASWREISKS